MGRSFSNRRAGTSSKIPDGLSVAHNIVGRTSAQRATREALRFVRMPDDRLHVTVECYAGHGGEETPRAFTLGDRRVVVDEVLDRWLAPDHRYFKVKGDDEHTYVIRHDEIAARWELTVFER